MPRSLPPETEHLADTIERAHATLAAARSTAERTWLANAEVKAAVARSKGLLQTLAQLRERLAYPTGRATRPPSHRGDDARAGSRW